MTERLSDEEYAWLAAEHALARDEEERERRLRELAAYGVSDVETLAAHTLAVMSAADTYCYRAARGREIYANDRLNTLVIVNEERPERSTVFANSSIELAASDRIMKEALRDFDLYGVEINIRIGGSAALEQDRQREREQALQAEVERVQRTEAAAAKARLEALQQEADMRAQLLAREQEQQRRDKLTDLSAEQQARALREELIAKGRAKREEREREREDGKDKSPEKERSRDRGDDFGRSR